jgi:hypothetical protein
VGLYLNYEQDLHFGGLQLGLTLPLITVSATSRSAFNRILSDQSFQIQNSPLAYIRGLNVDIIRRRVSDLSGIVRNTWDKAGIGDLDLHLRWNHIFDHVLLMKDIDLNFQIGSTFPTGQKTDINNPYSIPFGNDGFWTLYGDVVTAFQLKQDYTAGLVLGFVNMFSNSRLRRLSVGNEPTIFSALIAPVKIEPGFTFKISPYFILSNLTDGLDFQLRYTYLGHNKDRWKDLRTNQTPASYLSNPGIVGFKENLSLWRASFVTFNMTYDVKEATMRHYRFDPKFFATYDMPIGGHGFAKTYQFTIGTQLHF